MDEANPNPGADPGAGAPNRLPPPPPAVLPGAGGAAPNRLDDVALVGAGVPPPKLKAAGAAGAAAPPKPNAAGAGVEEVVPLPKPKPPLGAGDAPNEKADMIEGRSVTLRYADNGRFRLVTLKKEQSTPLASYSIIEHF